MGVYGSGLTVFPNLTWCAPRLQVFSRAFYRFHMGIAGMFAGRPVLYRDILDGRSGIAQRIDKRIHEVTNSSGLTDHQLYSRVFWLAQILAGALFIVVGLIAIFIEGI